MINTNTQTYKFTRLGWLCSLSVVLFFLSCTQNKKESKGKENIIPKVKESKFVSILNEPWDSKIYTRHQFYDFNSENCFMMENTKNIRYDTIHIISIDSKNKLKNYYLTSENYKNLEAFQIVHVQLDVAEIEKLINSLENKKHLKKLILYDCKIKKIPPSISKLTELKTLDLSINHLKTLPPEISQLKKLSYLRVGNNPEFTHFPNNLCELPNLEILEFKATAVSRINDEIANCKNLVSIKANAGKLSSISDKIGQCRNIKHINFGHNQIGNLPEGMGQLKKLEALILSGNKIDNLPESFEGMTNLKTVRLYKNQLLVFPDVLTKLKKIESIMIHDNKISSLPNSLGNLKKLYWFRIDDDKIPAIQFERLKEDIPKIRINEH